MSRNLAAVIVTFNRLEKLKETLEHTFAEPFHSVVVVNNASTDGTQEWLDAQTDERLHVIHSEQNEGGAGGFHRGFKYAAFDLPEADWLVAFDDDAYPEPGTVEKFQAMAIPDDVGSVAAAVYLPDGQISEMNRPSRNPFWHLSELSKTVFRGRSGFHIADADYQRGSLQEVDASSFVGFILRLSLIRQEKIGLPRTELFIYADDIIYVLELRKAGFKHLFAPLLRFTHDCMSLIDKEGAYHQLWKAYFVTRNKIEMYRIAAGAFFPLVMMVKIPSFLAMVRFYDRGKKRSYLRVARVAIRHGLQRRFSWAIADVNQFVG